MERPEQSRDEARMGSAAFLDPETRTSPDKRAPPLMTIFCTKRGARPKALYEAAPVADSAAPPPLPACSAHRLPNSRFLRQASLVQILY